MKKYLSWRILPIILLLNTFILAQNRHEFSLYAGGGLSTFNYDAASGEQKSGLGGLGGLGYSYFFTEKFGLRSGLEIAFYNSEYKLGDLSAEAPATDIDGNDFLFRSAISGYKEKHGAAMLQIPIMAQFQFGDDTRYYVAFGGKAGFPLSDEFKGSDAKVANSGYYGKENFEYTEQEFLGFGEYNAKGSKGAADFGVALLGSVETGMKFNLSDGLALYAGVYFDYGLNNAKPSGSKEIVEYYAQNTAEYSVNSILNSRSGGKPVVKEVAPMATGLKLQLAFGRGKTTP
ncbi:MAG: outer membrane beta-barrel protein, partial [Fibromonadales bacterium]|nr:outer membrane beta-barrel protein [Fibromonadales bacterium]